MNAVRVERVDADHLRLILTCEILLSNQDWERLRQAEPKLVWRDLDDSYWSSVIVCYREQPARGQIMFTRDAYDELLRIFKGPAL